MGISSIAHALKRLGRFAGKVRIPPELVSRLLSALIRIILSRKKKSDETKEPGKDKSSAEGGASQKEFRSPE